MTRAILILLFFGALWFTERIASGLLQAGVL
jgi:hypothetical protein